MMKYFVRDKLRELAFSGEGADNEQIVKAAFQEAASNKWRGFGFNGEPSDRFYDSISRCSSRDSACRAIESKMKRVLGIEA